MPNFRNIELTVFNFCDNTWFAIDCSLAAKIQGFIAEYSHNSLNIFYIEEINNYLRIYDEKLILFPDFHFCHFSLLVIFL